MYDNTKTNRKYVRIHIPIIAFIVTAAIYLCMLYVKINNLEFKPEPPQYEPYIEKIVISYGDSFDFALGKSRLSESDKTEIKKELAKIGFNEAKIQYGDFIEILYLAPSKQWVKFWYYPEGNYFYSIKKSDDNSIEASVKFLAMTTSKINVSGTITSSFRAAMSERKVPENIIVSFADIFAGKIDFLTQAREGDSFKIIYEIETVHKKDAILASKILAAQYKSESRIYNAIFFTKDDGKSGYFDEYGNSVKRTFLKAPLQFSRISTYFTADIKYPASKKSIPHPGIDYAAPAGTPVVAIGDGEITKAKYNGDFGNYVEIKHSNGYVTSYGQLSKYGRGIKKGVLVNQGQIIGYVGATGRATEPHLDFRISKNGEFINFLTMFAPSVPDLSGKDKEKFDNYKEEIFTELKQLTN